MYASGDALLCERLIRWGCGAGTLPPQWSALNLEVINLDRNALSGMSPTAIHATEAAPIHQVHRPSVPSRDTFMWL